LVFLNIIWDLFLQLDHDTETKNGRKKNSLRSKRFRVKIGASAKKCTRPNFYAVKKAKNASNLRKSTETLVTKAKNLKNTMLRG